MIQTKLLLALRHKLQQRVQRLVHGVAFVSLQLRQCRSVDSPLLLTKRVHEHNSLSAHDHWVVYRGQERVQLF